MAFYLTGRRARRFNDGAVEGQLLRAIAIELAERKATRLDDDMLRDHSLGPATLPSNGLVAIGPFVSVVFPFGLIFAAAAPEHIAAVSPPAERGERRVRAAMASSWTVAGLLLLIRAVVAKN